MGARKLYIYFSVVFHKKDSEGWHKLSVFSKIKIKMKENQISFFPLSWIVHSFLNILTYVKSMLFKFQYILHQSLTSQTWSRQLDYTLNHTSSFPSICSPSGWFLTLTPTHHKRKLEQYFYVLFKCLLWSVLLFQKL